MRWQSQWQMPPVCTLRTLREVGEAESYHVGFHRVTSFIKPMLLLFLRKGIWKQILPPSASAKSMHMGKRERKLASV